LKGGNHMSIEEIAAKWKKIHENYIEKTDRSALDEIYAPDVVSHLPPFPDVTGHEGSEKAAAIHQGFTDRHIDLEETIIQGDTIAMRYTTYDRHTGLNPLFSTPPTGKEIGVKGSVFLHVKDNKIVEEFNYVDMLGMMQQLGVISPMGKK
jgi:predicted ester cyclase